MRMPLPVRANSRLKVFFNLKTKRDLYHILIIMILAIQFQFNSRVGDDWPNSNSASYVSWRYGKLTLVTLWNEISYWIAAWANGQGRFFPMAVIQVQTVFAVFRTQEAVRIFYGVTFVLFCLLWVSLIRKLTQNPNTATYFLISFAFCMQFRRDFEPHIGFGQMLIWAAIWFALSAHMLLNSMNQNKKLKRNTYSVLSGVFYFLSLCQYELTFLMLPLFLCVIFFKYFSEKNALLNKKKILLQFRYLSPISLMTFVYISIVFLYLRPKANPDGAYVLGFNIYNSIRAFLIQGFASLPLTGHSFDDSFKFPINLNYTYLVGGLIVLFAITIKNISKIASQEQVTISKYSSKVILLISLTMGTYLIFVPSFMISLQPAWWPRLHFGSSYLGVLFAEIGMSFIIASLMTSKENMWNLKTQLRKSQSKQIKKIYPTKSILHSKSFKLLVISMTAITFLSNFRMIESTKNRDNLSASWSTLTEDGTFFTNLKDRDFLFSTTFNDAYEINVANIYEKTQIRLGQIFYPPYVWPSYLECQTLSECPLTDIRSKSTATLANYSRGQFSGIAALTKQKGFAGDWPSILLKPNAIDASSFWYFNIFMITETTALSYLVPMDDDPKNALARPGDVTLYTMVAKDAAVITPAFMGVCLEKQLDSKLDLKSSDGIRLIKWALPSIFRGPSGILTQLPDRVDIRRIETGSC